MMNKQTDRRNFLQKSLLGTTGLTGIGASITSTGSVTAETVSQDGSRSVRAIQFPGAVLLRYFDLRTGALHIRAGGARAAAAALEPGRFDDADPDTEERWSGSGRHHFQDQLPIAPAVMRSFRRRTQAQDTADAAAPEPEGRRSRSFSMED
ncbi:MAG: hypothetical protein CBC46_06160, partial [Verrucomicrobiaceae bacterium TMED86]